MRIRSVLSHTAQAVAEGALVALLVVALAAGTTFAAKGGGGGASTGGGGHKGGGGSTSGATLAVSPSTLTAGGATYTVSGSGYGPGNMVSISIANPGCCVAFPVASDASGNISFQSTTGSAGTYVVKSYKYGTTTQLASTSFTVTP